MTHLRVRGAAALSLAAAACADWPTWKHVENPDPVGSAAGTPPGVALWEQVDWAGPDEEGANNEVPPDTEDMALGAGHVWDGALQGWGWDGEATTGRVPPEGCDSDSDFPPVPTGDYSGDLDWFGVEPAAAGAFCAAVRLRPAEELPDLRFDMLLYDLDECGAPVRAWRFDDLATDSNPEGVLGFTLGGTAAAWGVEVEEGARLGVVLAGVWPDDEESGGTVTVGWTLALSLVGTAADGAAGPCPTLPAEDGDGDAP